MSFVAIVALALLAAPAFEDWEKVFTTENGLVAFVDNDSVRRTGNVVLVNERRDYAKVEGGDYSEMLIASRYDCAARTVQVLSVEASYRAGGAPRSFSWDDSPVDPANAGTLAGAVLEHVCSPD
jgi:hypothetical protein